MAATATTATRPGGRPRAGAAVALARCRTAWARYFLTSVAYWHPAARPGAPPGRGGRRPRRRGRAQRLARRGDDGRDERGQSRTVRRGRPAAGRRPGPLRRLRGAPARRAAAGGVPHDAGPLPAGA